jgi:hypothetical protein
LFDVDPTTYVAEAVELELNPDPANFCTVLPLPVPT